MCITDFYLQDNVAFHPKNNYLLVQIINLLFYFSCLSQSISYLSDYYVNLSKL